MVTRRELLEISFGALGGLVIAPSLAFAQNPSQWLKAALDANTLVAQDATTFFFTGIDVTLTQDILPGTKNLVVRADIVRIPGSISLPGRNLIVLARQIVSGPRTKIVTKALRAAEDFTNSKAPNGARPGDPGQNGRDGGSGRDGGDVTLYAREFLGPLNIDASGGDGGAAESGGSGAPGKNGDDWSDKMVAGENGGDGGKAGAPGTPGVGGKAGAILVVSLSESAPLPKVTATTLGGSPGAPGKAGLAGDPGQPGKGGKKHFTEWFPCPPT